MKYTFIDNNLSRVSVDLIETANGIIENIQAQGYDLTLRQLYYQFVANDLLPQKWADSKTGSTNNERSYKNLGTLINKGRLMGLVDWDVIVDRTRELKERSHWSSPAGILDAAIASYRINMWINQPYYVEVWVEKEALVGVLEKVCNRWDVSYFSCKGYVSQSAMYEAANRISEQITDYEKEIKVLYLGDHDPSGLDMVRDIGDRLEMLSDGDFSSTINMEHIALTREQIDELNPPPNPTKVTDSRAKEYIALHGHSSWELDALEPRYIDKLIEKWIKSFVDDDIWVESEEKYRREKELLEEKAEEIKEAVSK